MKLIINDEHFVQRDINWLSFNERVLQEAKDKRNPLFERLKFLAIFSSNLDEFFRVRVSNLRQIKKIDKPLKKRLQLRPSKIIKEIISIVSEQQEVFGNVFNQEILPELKRYGVYLINESAYNQQQKEYSKIYFDHHLKDLIEIKNESDTALHLDDGELYFCVTLHDSSLHFVKIPVGNERFVQLPSTEENKWYFTFKDDIVKQHIKCFFAEKAISSIYEIKLSRDAELYLEDDYDGDLVSQIYESLSQRNIGQPTRLLFDKSMPRELKKRLRKILDLGKIDMIPGGTYHNFSDFMDFPNPTKKPELSFQSKPPLEHPVFRTTTDYFKTIAEKDRLLHLPYQQFDYVSNWVAQAANDDHVKTIKISLYRIAKTSKLSEALLTAIEKGKEVTIFVEAQARFDEENNLKWGKIFEEKGATVLYSIPNIKVHSKILLIQRVEDEALKNYAYISTGNFNSKTSRVYSDHGLFTADSRLTDELQQVFEVLERKLIIPKLKNLVVSPFNTRTKFTSLIENEIKNARLGNKAKITAKMNSLQDRKIIEKLYEASNEGVEIRLLIRGFTSLMPETAQISENIYITSVVDQFLEHGRIYIFENGGEEQMYIGSADWMTRNLDRRIEVLTPIYDSDVYKELKHILALQLADNFKARTIDKQSSNQYVQEEGNVKTIRSQYEIYDYLKAKLK
ncbi:polyphosphate kinase 1 [Zhouia sp. PK063]|uniref:polyphosphate kinase 1 n=1 Tax=Zhouia sp. PK063 TaxID=3373602 RepID=UPI0037B0AF64